VGLINPVSQVNQPYGKSVSEEGVEIFGGVRCETANSSASPAARARVVSRGREKRVISAPRAGDITDYCRVT